MVMESTRMLRARGILDLEAQFAFFRSQHRHPVNAAVHVLVAGPILLSNLLILYFLPLPYQLDPALALSLTYAAAYLAIDRRAGALAAILLLGAWAASRALAARLGFALAWKVVLATQLFCLTWQLLGHELFELLNKLFGYEPYPGFINKVDKKMEAYLKESIEHEQMKTN